MSKTAAPNDAAPRSQAAKVVMAVLALIGYEGALHFTAVHAMDFRVGPLISLIPLLLLLCAMIWRKSRAAGLLSVLLVSIGAIELGFSPQVDLKPFYPAPHIAIYLLLLVFFARTLRPGCEPLVTRIARHEHGTLPADIERYTRHVTLAWCAFFAGMVLASVLLFAFAPLPVWSWFANVLNVPLLLLMFLVEYAVRLLRFPDFTHASFFTAIRAVCELGRAAKMQGR
jgi:uncharacterized membrane protein